MVQKNMKRALMYLGYNTVTECSLEKVSAANQRRKTRGRVLILQGGSDWLAHLRCRGLWQSFCSSCLGPVQANHSGVGLLFPNRCFLEFFVGIKTDGAVPSTVLCQV